MMKYYTRILIPFILCSFPFVSFAQEGNFKLGAGLNGSAPLGLSANLISAGIGCYVKPQYAIKENNSLTFTTGYDYYVPKKGTDYKNSVIPFLLGYKFGEEFYIEPQLGYGLYHYKDESTSQSTWTFTWCFGGGYQFNRFDIGVHYRSAGTQWGSGSLMLHAGYNFQLGKKMNVVRTR